MLTDIDSEIKEFEKIAALDTVKQWNSNAADSILFSWDYQESKDYMKKLLKGKLPGDVRRAIMVLIDLHGE